MAKDDSSSYCTEDSDCESNDCFLGALSAFRVPNRCAGSENFQGNVVTLDSAARHLGALDNTHYWVTNLNGVGQLQAWNRTKMPPRLMRLRATDVDIKFAALSAVDTSLITLNAQSENDLYELNTPPDTETGGRQALRSIFVSSFEEGYWVDTDERDGENGCVCEAADVPAQALEDGQTLVCMSAIETQTSDPTRKKACVTIKQTGTFGCRSNNESFCGPVSSPASDGLAMTWVTTRTNQITQVDEYEIWATNLDNINDERRLAPALVARQSGELSSPRIFLDSMLYLDHQSGRPRVRLAEPGAQDWAGLTMTVDGPKKYLQAGLQVLVYSSYDDANTPGLYALSASADETEIPAQGLFDLLPNNEHLLPPSQQADWAVGAGYVMSENALVIAARVDPTAVEQIGAPCAEGETVPYRIYSADLTGARSSQLTQAFASASVAHICADPNLSLTGIRISTTTGRQIFYSLQTDGNDGGGLYWVQIVNGQSVTHHLSANADALGRDCKHLAVDLDDNGTNSDTSDDGVSVLCTGFTSDRCQTENGQLPLDPTDARCWSEQFARLYALTPVNPAGHCGQPVCDGLTQGPDVFALNADDTICLAVVPLESTVDGFDSDAVKGYIADVTVSDGEKNIAFEFIDGEIRRIYLLTPNSLGSYVSDARGVPGDDCEPKATAPLAEQVFARAGDDLGQLNLTNRFLILADAGQSGQSEILRIRISDGSVERLTADDSVQHHPTVNTRGEIYYVDSRYRQTALGEEIFSPAVTRRFTLNVPVEECETHAECADQGGYCSPQTGVCSLACENAEQCADGEECGVPANVNCGAAGPLRTCLAPNAVNRECPACIPEAEVCDGQDNDCDDAIDEDLAVAPIECGVGACRADGVSRCVDGENVEFCEPGQPAEEVCADVLDNDCDGASDEVNCQNPEAPCEPQAESCDGIDNDCDGAIDEAVDPVASQCGQGICAAQGERTCVDGQTVDSCQEGQALAETCDDQLDNDCDGQTDEADCAGGEAPCVPGPEVCDGQDNDCDEVVDEGIAPEASQCGTGACAAQGQITCVDGNAVNSCQPGLAGPEICDGEDNDCDGQLDEGLAPVATQCGVGACASTGEESCVNGEIVDSCQAGVAGIEVCDGEDNDCDTNTDEDIAPVPTECGVGACAAVGEETCVGAELVDSCQEGAPAAELCGDNLDNNCDDAVDEVGCEGQPTGGPCVTHSDCANNALCHLGNNVCLALCPLNGCPEDQVCGVPAEGITCEEAGARRTCLPQAFAQDCDGQEANTCNFDEHVQAIFDNNCTACHSGDFPANGLQLSAGAAYDSLVGQASGYDDQLILVVPNSDATSFLWNKVTVLSPLHGARMPRGGPRLPQAQLNNIRAWIMGGAPNGEFPCP